METKNDPEMKTTVKSTIIIIMAMVTLPLVAQDIQKKVKTFQVTKVLPFTAAQVWAVVAEDYGRIAHSHPKIIASEYLNGSLKGGEGAERVCYFNDKQTQYLKEKMVDYSPEQMRFTNTVYKAGKFPVDPASTRAIYSVRDLGNGTSELTFDMQFRTKPAFMGGMMKGAFKKLIADYFIAIEHHLTTGESVTKDNFKQIKKNYAAKQKAQAAITAQAR